uniref:helix-turn-helix domain-containing protein n=1 Tax=Ndongobacter massiliensis TaxID=1871025 RepID=UPI000931BF7A|nr:helix-turn-helix transcriptional regulator [Ndongobacter massiliensis]
MESKLKAIRRRKCLSQKDLAEMAGTSTSTIVRTELGHSRETASGTLQDIARVLHVSTDDLIDSKEDAKKIRAAHKAWRNKRREKDVY